MPGIDPYRCKNCGHVFVAPKLYLTGGEKLKVCPFCDGREMEEFEISLEEEDLILLEKILALEHPDIPLQRLEKLRRKIGEILDVLRKGEFEVRVRRVETS